MVNLVIVIAVLLLVETSAYLFYNKKFFRHDIFAMLYIIGMLLGIGLSMLFFNMIG